MTVFVILTATVTPNTTTRVSLLDPAVRLAQYQVAMADWLAMSRQSDFTLVVVETSGATVQDLFSGSPDDAADVLFHSFTPAPGVVERGKGAMEWAAIASVIDAFRDRMASDDTIYKATGRLSVVNASSVIVPLAKREIRLRKRIDGHLSDTRILGASVEVWEDLLLPAEEFVDLGRGIDIEHCVAAEVQRAVALKRVEWSRFPVRPRFSGESGYNGQVYRPYRTKLKSLALRPIERCVTFASARVGH